MSNHSPAAEQFISRKSEDDSLLTEQPQTDAALQMKSVYRASYGGTPPGSGDGDNTKNKSLLFNYLSVQPKLTIGGPNDRYEQEADRVASKIMLMPEDARHGWRMSDTGSIQRACTKCEDEDVQLQRTSGDHSIISSVQRQTIEEEKEPQVKPMVQLQAEEEEPQAKGDGTTEASPDFQKRIGNTKGSGEPLGDSTSLFMGTRIGADFSNVRVHTDSNAVNMSNELSAQAFTHGRDIYFNEGKYDPDTSSGKSLLAHELTHTVQQGAAGLQTTTKVLKSSEEDEQKEEVEVQTKKDTAHISSSPMGIQRGIWDSITGASDAVWDATGGKLVDAAGNVIEMTSDLFWGLIEKVAPGFVPIVREISSKGIVGFLKDKISQAVNHIFDGLNDGSGTLTPLFGTFRELVAKAGEIVVALSSGDCKPLFVAVNQLKDMVSKMAGDAWRALTDFFTPIGAFLSDVWQSFGAPVLDWLGQTAKDVWVYIKGLGQQFWAWTQPVRDAVGGAWNWVKNQIGIGGNEGDGDSEGGMVQWIKEKADEAWGVIKEQLKPIIEPIQAVVEKVKAILPLKAIFNLRETIQGWLAKAEAMGQAMGDDGGNVAEEQTSLRDEILPAVLTRIESLRVGLINAGLWISEKIGSMVTTVTGFVSSLSTSPLLNGLRLIVMWIQTGIQQLSEWAQTKVVFLFNLIGDGLVKLSKFVRPILDVLTQVVETIKNLMGKLPDLIMGPIWWILPDCIKNPIKDFILNQILMRIPLFQQFMEIGDIWAKVQATAMKILKQVFVNGDLFGALWTYFKAVLGIFGIPPQLITNIIIKASQALGDILANPIGFIINILKAVKEGFVRFFSNILKHLFGGVTGWLFGQMKDAGITIPEDFSLKSILNLVFQILGLTMEKIWKKLAEKIGQEKVDRLKDKIATATGVWEWIRLAADGGPGAIWEKLKEKIGNLWGSVITGVVNWVNSVIIVQGTKWLMSMLDVSGITPTITALIAMYKAIESFFQYFNQMLEIVNSVLNGIADIAKGAISNAAGFLESALAKTVPIIIGFLANQFGLGKLGHRLREIIGGVQAKVDGALDWIIDKAINTGKAFLNSLNTGVSTVKEGVKGLIAWWKVKTPFKTKGGDSHELYYESHGTTVVPMVASGNPQPISDSLDDIESDGNAEIKRKVGVVRDELPNIQESIRNKQPYNDRNFVIKIKDLFETRESFGGPVKTGDVEVSPSVSYTAGTLTLGSKSNTVGKRMEAKFLASNHPIGSGPGTSQSDIFSVLPTKGNVDKPEHGSRDANSMYIKGHLLNDNLGGPGEDRNLFPITQKANQEHERNIEADAKDLVNKKAFIVNYVVETENITKQPLVILGSETFHPVNADFRCELSTYKKIGEKLEKITPVIKKATIHSTYLKPSAVSLEGESEVDENSTKFSEHDESKVKWAPGSSRNKASKLSPLDGDEKRRLIAKGKDNVVRELKEIGQVGNETANNAWNWLVNNGSSEGLGDTLIPRIENVVRQLLS